MPLLARTFGQQGLLAFAVLTATLATAPAGAQQLWFSPPDDHPRSRDHFITADGFTRMFEQPEEWAFAASHTKVFGIDTSLAIDGPEEKLRRMFDFFAAHDIAVNVALQALYTEGCGKGIEGLVQVQHYPGDIARRLKRLGFDVPYFAFDGPLAFGHIYKGKEACGYSVREVAHRLAHTVADVRSSYPNAKFVDYEGPTDLPLQEWVPTWREWLDAYRAETGTELDAMAIDTNWRKDWRAASIPTIDLLHAHGAKAGIFLTATGGPTVTDESWLTEAKQNIRDVVAAKLPVDFVVISSWMQHPWRLVPETDPLTMTNLVDWYVHYRESPDGAKPR
jgi:hypothetical protein